MNAQEQAETALNNWNGGAGRHDAAWVARRAEESSNALRALLEDHKRQATTLAAVQALFAPDDLGNINERVVELLAILDVSAYSDQDEVSQ